MNQEKYILYPFLRAARGNWRNALFIKCASKACPYGMPFPCEGYLFSADADGTPLLVPVEYFRSITGETIAKEECQGTLTCQAFEAAYASYIEWHTPSACDCSLRQLCMAPQPRKP